MGTFNVGISSNWKKIAKANADNALMTVTPRASNIEFATTDDDTAPVETGADPIDGHTIDKQSTHTFILSNGERLWYRSAGNKTTPKLAATGSGDITTFPDA